ncbi:MAG TPA: M48 family metalloprotease [Gammaproteobacteria bacterium]
MRAFPALIVLCLAATGAARAAGKYEPVPLEDDERHLIESSQELEAYFRDQSLLYGNEDVVALVRRVGETLAPTPVDDYVDYRFFVLRDPSPNAFALPNGHVYVHTGMLARLEDESQLAALLGHELTHVAGHHGILNHRTATKRTIAALVLGGLGGGWGSVISVGLQASVFGYSRDLEQEADDHAVALLADGPYDPHALPEVLDILGRDYEGLQPRMATIWSTHPEIRARAETSRALVQDLPRRQRDPQAFDAVIFPLRLLTIRDYIQDDYPHTALALAESLAERYPDDPRVQHVLGDAWAALGAQRRLDPDELSNADKRRNLRDRARHTREQRLEELLETEEGRAAYRENLTRAAEVQRRALALDPGFAPAHRSLGEAYERLGRPRDAAAAYLQYARLAPDAPDRALVVDRLRELAEVIKAEEDDDD